jgi:hypothetical protein
MQSTPPPAEERIVCANHPNLGAVFTCERCGSFGCENCRSASQPTLCQQCVQRVAPVVLLTAGALLQDSFSLLGRNLPGVGFLLAGSLGGSLLTSSLLLLLPNPDGSVLLLILVSASLSSFATAVFLSWTAQRLLQQPGRPLLSSLRVGLLRFSSLLLMSLLFGIIVAAGMLCLFLPGIYLAICMSLAPALVVLEGLGPLQSLHHSYRLTRGHRLTLLVVFAAMLLLQLVLALAGQLFLSALGAPSWLGMALFQTLYQALGSALFLGAVVLAWMRLTGRVPSST